MKGRRLYNGAVIQKWGLIVYDIGRPLQNDALLKFQAELIKSAYVLIFLNGLHKLVHFIELKFLLN